VPARERHSGRKQLHTREISRSREHGPIGVAGAPVINVGRVAIEAQSYNFRITVFRVLVVAAQAIGNSLARKVAQWAMMKKRKDGVARDHRPGDGNTRSAGWDAFSLSACAKRARRPITLFPASSIHAQPRGVDLSPFAFCPGHHWINFSGRFLRC